AKVGRLPEVAHELSHACVGERAHPFCYLLGRTGDGDLRVAARGRVLACRVAREALLDLVSVFVDPDRTFPRDLDGGPSQLLAARAQRLSSPGDLVRRKDRRVPHVRVARDDLEHPWADAADPDRRMGLL